jgi:hypothetical protein
MKLPERSYYTFPEAAEMWDTTVTALLHLWSDDKIRCAVKLETRVYLCVGAEDEIESLLNMGTGSLDPIPLDRNDPIYWADSTKRPLLFYEYDIGDDEDEDEDEDDEPLDSSECLLPPVRFYFPDGELLWCDSAIANSFLRGKKIASLGDVGPWDYDGTRKKWRGPYIFSTDLFIDYPVTIDQILIPTTEVRRLDDLHKKSIDASNNDILGTKREDTLNGMIAAMAVIISEDKSGKYQHGGKPNFTTIATRINQHFPDRTIDTIRKQLAESSE